jgi:hypothetical protein
LVFNFNFSKGEKMASFKERKQQMISKLNEIEKMISQIKVGVVERLDEETLFFPEKKVKVSIGRSINGLTFFVRVKNKLIIGVEDINVVISSNSKDKNLVNIGLEHQRKSGSCFSMTAAIITKS